ncbi:hypothetical protein B0H14DRAFT_2874075 [Mycena olivaceomarginata]|nr:hypothetical protein B0H14DRAFT_2874075 [Mycena olivaceomarginata]
MIPFFLWLPSLASSPAHSALSIGSGGTRALCCRPPSACRCNLVVPTVFRLSHTRAPVSQLARVVAPLCAKGCTICPCDFLTRARVHALLVPPKINEQSQLGDRDPELAAYMPRHRASSDLHCGGVYGAWDRGETRI